MGSRALLLLTCWVLFSASANASYRSGTIVVVAISGRGAAVAADSRQHPSNGPATDLECKVTAVGRTIAFAMTGISGFLSQSEPTENWDGVTDLRRTAERDPNLSADSLASAWGSQIRKRFEHELSVRASELIGATEPGTSALATGIFLGTEDGSPVVYLSKVELTNTADSVRTTTVQIGCIPFCAIGRTEIATELREEKTERSIAWNAQLSKKIETAAPEEAAEVVAIFVADLTVRFHPRQDTVGGPIDALRLDGSGVKWIKRKPSCSAE